MNRVWIAMFVTLLTLPGCLPVVAGTMIASGNSKAAKNHAAYSEYVTKTQETNTDREKAGLKPYRILSYEDWKDGSETGDVEK